MVNGPGHRHLDRRVGVALAGTAGPRPRPGACGGSGPTMRGTGFGMARAVERGARVVDVDALERGGEAVGVALAPDLAVGDDVEAGLLLRPDREDASRRPAPRRGSGSGMRHSSFARTRGGKRPASFARSISHSGCGIAADERGGKQHLTRHGLRPWKTFSRPTLIENSPSYMKTSAVAKVSP